ncbi:hypothetical protein [Bacteroides sp. 51]|uniref:hypothetical protein n=1 Tax=Bacteroides sp. 51 TaxID=2302938 RepID=UPI0013D7B3E6|nr:hypothetical protein [Bacteroides sp. 51]NDV84805.1 hypothetical protein [Bacteroides sp. 51]
MNNLDYIANSFAISNSVNRFIKLIRTVCGHEQFSGFSHDYFRQLSSNEKKIDIEDIYINREYNYALLSVFIATFVNRLVHDNNMERKRSEYINEIINGICIPYNLQNGYDDKELLLALIEEERHIYANVEESINAGYHKYRIEFKFL